MEAPESPLIVAPLLRAAPPSPCTSSRQGMNQYLELTTAILIVRKHVETGTGRGQQDHIAWRCPLRRKTYGVPQGVRLSYRGETFPGPSQQRRRFSDQNHARDPPADC